jgi:hypothetical protein
MVISIMYRASMRSRKKKPGENSLVVLLWQFN